MIKLLIFFSFALNGPSAVTPMDSIGVETVNGKLFVIHRVDERETLFAISRRYHTTVDAIVEHNKDADKGLEIGQILKIPYTKPAAKPLDAIVHVVEAKETMFSISKKYNVSTDDIKQWNNLTDNTLSIGQQLFIRKKGVIKEPASIPVTSRKGVHTVGAQETLFSIAKRYNVTTQQLKQWNNLDDTALKIGQTLFVSQPEQTTSTSASNRANTNTNPPSENAVRETPIKKEPEVKREIEKKEPEPVKEVPTIHISESVKNGNELVEGGLAELIEGTEGNRKYLALHRTAPIGTILKVRNEMNNREVFVRVTGKLPDTALTDKVIIRISKSAYDRLGAIDQRFRVEVTYYK